MTSKRSPRTRPAIEQSVLATLPWTCTHFGDTSEIEAFAPGTGTWETVADVRTVGDCDAEDLAAFIIQAVNSCNATGKQLRDLADILRDCLRGKSISDAARRRANDVLQSIASLTD